MLTDSYERTPADLGYCPDVSTDVPVVATRTESDSMVARVNMALSATAIGFSFVSGEIARHMDESVTHARMAGIGTGVILLAAYNAFPLFERFESGRRIIARSQLASEQATYESQQKQRRIDEKNQLRAPMKQKTRELIRRTQAVHASRQLRFTKPIPGEVLL